MKVTINSVKFKTDKKLEEFITEKVQKLTINYNDIIGSEVILKIENGEDLENKIAEIRLMIPGNDLFAKKTCKTFEGATDQAVEALKKQLIKHKEKLRGI
ncbi:MAG: ribosome-associated translation inhibitor RaiA [Bacteroidetes bacterium]|nr:ribosome-associated translation inhibitor RaiA [Bacteroidota bacterium]